MAKFFNTTGLCVPEKHYMVDPLSRLAEVQDLIGKELYFTLHAPRQTGKTTCLHALAQKLNTEDKYIALVASFERAGVPGLTLDRANHTLNKSIYQSCLLQLPESYRAPEPHKDQELHDYLSAWCRNLPKPVVLLVDEIDALFDDVLISVLRQLRDGFQGRPKGFPSSIALVGLRDVRDYKASLRSERQSLGTASPFNVKSKALLLENFTAGQVSQLLDQHTSETGQVFSHSVRERLFALSQGQPWLVNALANEIVNEILKGDLSAEITEDLVDQAKNQLILRRDTHLDSLIDKLREDRVKRIVQAIINGDMIHFDVLDDDIAYVRDLGLVAPTKPMTFANPIYAEIIPRVMASPMDESIPAEIQTPWFLTDEGLLDMDKLLKAFQAYYRRHSGAWLDRFEYRESAQHLLLMTFLQRVVNSGGDIVREMALGNHRIDMFVRFKEQAFAFELKIRRDTHTLPEGREQLARYLDTLGMTQGYLVIFDSRDRSWEEKITWEQETYEGKTITVVGV